jgi:hypothetical protein
MDKPVLAGKSNWAQPESAGIGLFLYRIPSSLSHGCPKEQGPLKMQEWRLTIHQGVVLIQFDSGTVVTPPMLKDIYRGLNAEPEKFRATKVVWDFRNIQFHPDIGYEKVLELVKHVEHEWDDSWQVKKSAIVAKSKAFFGVCRIYASLVNDQLNYEVNVFENNLQAAIDWAQPDA